MAEEIKVRFYVNNKEIVAKVPADLSLMKFLREYLDLTGTKNGCSKGHCGACTVILNGKETRSCLMKMSKIKDGSRVETIEGVAENGELHPIQQMFIVHGAVQCGFCTPGMIMTAKALLESTSHPTENEIKVRLTKNRNLCRCTGYENIVKAIKAAGDVMASGETLEPLGPEGFEVTSTQLRKDAIEKVKGETKFGADIKMERMLYGKIKWGEHPHAEVINIDTSEAEAMNGVVRVIIAKDIPGKNATGNLFRDQPAIVYDKVRYIGDHVACVFAESEEIAAQAVEKIKIKYNILPAVFTPEDAAKPDAPKIHEKGNLCHHAKIERGNVNKAFESCAVIVERHYSTPFIEHAFMEPESGVAHPTENGGMTLLYSSQTVFDVQQQLAEILDMPKEKIRVIQIPQGGSFGGKEDPIFEVYLALGALLTGRPVKIVLTREESLRVHVKRHPAWMWFKTGADKDGHVIAIDYHVTVDTGAYISLGIDVLENMVVFGAGPYYVPNLRLEGHSWFTNNVLCGAMRGFGVNQVASGLEQNMDEMARTLNIDPFMFRIINGLDSGLPTASDHVLEPGVAGLKETVVAARDAFKGLRIPSSVGNKKIGIGVASAVKNVGYGHNVPESAGSIIELDKSGDVTIKVSHHEYGQGGLAGQVKIAVNELGIPVDRFKVIGPDTSVTPPTGPTTASRQTFLTGNATVLTCRALKEDLFARVAEEMDESPEAMKFDGDEIVHLPSGKRVRLATLGEKFIYKRRYTPPETTALLENEASHYGKSDFKSRITHYAYAYNTQVAIVEVDIDTGEVQVLTIISANDVGKILNKKIIEGQIHGGVVQGIGYALLEEYIIENGWNKTDTLNKYKIPTPMHTPEIISVPVEVPHPFGPQGVKGFAEAPSMATAPAILNAIYDAIGERIVDLPAKKERVLSAIRKGYSW